MTKILRRFNYTQRTKIPRSKVHIDTDRADEGACTATVRQLDLSDRGQHSAEAWNPAEVFLEARRTSSESFARMPLGTVSELQNGGLPKKVTLEQFGDDAGITFRIKVVDRESRLLADGDEIHSGMPENSDREPLIYLVPTDLGEELWRMDWTGTDGPRVLVNIKLTNSSALLTRDPLIRGLIMPQIVRAVLPNMVHADQKSDDWVRKWSEFATHLGFSDIPDEEKSSEDEVQEWIENIVAKFTTNLKFASAAEAYLQKAHDE